MSDRDLSAEIKALRQVGTCAVASAIETFGVRLRNEGFTNSSLRGLFPRLPPMVGLAATLRVRSSQPPMGAQEYPERAGWWEGVLNGACPRVVVIEDADSTPGTGALIGEAHAHIFRALGCVGAVTNGSARGIPALEEMGFPVFSTGLAVSHAYVHIVEAGGEVTIAGLKIRPGDLLHGDQHGIVSVPIELAAAIPRAAAKNARDDRAVIEACRPGNFSLEGLRAATREHPLLNKPANQP